MPSVQLWHVKETPDQARVLGSIMDEAAFGTYGAAEYAAGAAALPLTSAVHIEAIVGLHGPVQLDPVAETEFIVAQTQKAPGFGGRPVAIVPHVDLAAGADAVVAAIARHRAVAGDTFVGVRTILNWCDKRAGFCWPQVGGSQYLSGSNAAFNEGWVDTHTLQRRHMGQSVTGRAVSRYTRRPVSTPCDCSLFVSESQC
jgi:hypothetical protein